MNGISVLIIRLLLMRTVRFLYAKHASESTGPSKFLLESELVVHPDTPACIARREVESRPGYSSRLGSRDLADCVMRMAATTPRFLCSALTQATHKIAG